MFNRNNLPSMPNPFGQRPDGSQRPPAGGRDSYGREQQPQRGQDTQMGGGYSDRQPPQYSGGQHHPGGAPQSMPARRPPPQQQQSSAGGATGRALQLQPCKSPGGNAFAFGNLAAVSPQDFQPKDGGDIYIIVNDNHVLTARILRDCPPGQIGLTDAQRTWAQVSMGPQEFCKVQTYDPFGPGSQYLGNMTMDIGFASRKSTEEPYDQDVLAAQVIKSYSEQVLSPGQVLLMDYKNIPLRLIVKSVELTDLNVEKRGEAPTRTDPQARGFLFNQTKIDFFKDPRSEIKLKASNRRAAANSIITPDFKFEAMGIGGLDNEFSAIFRRAFASRIFPPGLVERLGIQHVRGMLLYGPPGTGKTLIARQIGRMLNAREPKVINGPEILNKYVGASEENVRKMFADAEKEYKEKGDESGLHIIIFDELDAVCKQRGSGAGGGTGVGDSVVNQLLSKLDGVDQLNNILLIGMTNRMDMIDEALLRAGRLEVHMEISLPDEHGRAQILKIHTQKMKTNNVMDTDVDLAELARLTKNFSGAEISGLVKAASSFAFSRHIKVGTMAGIKDDVENMKVNQSDFMSALEEVKPLFGVSEEEISKRFSRGIIQFSPHIDSLLKQGSLYVNQVRSPNIATQMLSVLIHGPPGAGKTALAAKMGIDSEAPFLKLLSPGDMVGYSEMQKVGQFDKTFRDAYKSPFSIIVIDEIELLLDWVPVGPRFSNTCLVALKALLSKEPPKDRKLLILATTTERSIMQQLQLRFNEEIAVPNLRSQRELANVLSQSGWSEQDTRRAIQEIQDTTGSETIGVGIKDVLLGMETAAASGGEDVAGTFASVIAGKIASNTF